MIPQLQNVVIAYTYNPRPMPMGESQWVGLLIILGIFAVVIALACWHSMKDWIKWIRYRNYTVKSFIVCQKTPDIDLKKIYKVVDETNDFLRGRNMHGIRVDRRKIKTKHLISVTSIPGDGCYYFIVWYKGKGRPE